MSAYDASTGGLPELQRLAARSLLADDSPGRPGNSEINAGLRARIAALEAELAEANRTNAELRAWMDENRDKTADGKWVDELGDLYCPKCGSDIDDIRGERAYCWSCEGEEPGSSACFFFSQCYSTREAALAAREIKTSTQFSQ